jgi:putative transposase
MTPPPINLYWPSNRLTKSVALLQRLLFAALFSPALPNHSQFRRNPLTTSYQSYTFVHMSKARSPQLALLKKTSLSYGGELLKTRAGRLHGRPLDTKNTMHLVLRSSKAKGKWSFRTPKNSRKINEIIMRFSEKYKIQILTVANVGNHLHLHIKLSSRHTYKAFIRAVTSAIAMAVTGINRWTKANIKSQLNQGSRPKNKMPLPSALTSSLSKTDGLSEIRERSIKGQLKFWDYRPFTRVIQGYRAMLTLKDYLLINQFEGMGHQRLTAKIMIARYGPKSAKQFLLSTL